MRRYLIPFLALVGLAFAVNYSISRTPPGNKTVPPSAPPETTSDRVVAAEGLVEPASENIAIGSAVPGLVTKLYVKAGDRVRSGSPLFSLDDREITADLGVKRANLAAAKARLAKLERSPRPEEIPPAAAKVAEAQALLSDAEVQVRLIESVTDRRAVRDEDVQRRRLNYAAAKARLQQAQDQLALLKAGTWSADLTVAKAEVEQAAAAIRQDEINLERLTMRAPMDGVVLQNRVRLGQYAQVGQSSEALMIFGAGKGIHVRADVDENDAWRVRSGAPATARLRGNSRLSYPLEFVRFEPYVIPKKSLTGDVSERIDTRALQVIYRFRDADARVFDGQQLDVFIETNIALNRENSGTSK